MDRIVRVRVKDEMLNNWSNVCESKGINISILIRMAVQEYLDRQQRERN